MLSMPSHQRRAYQLFVFTGKKNPEPKKDVVSRITSSLYLVGKQPGVTDPLLVGH